MMDGTLSNLTSAISNEASISSTTNLADVATIPRQQYNPTPPPKKRRNLPGHPDPDAEVVALSPRALMATNRFVCEICNKGFQREQNLQLHRRGHNLPWKLKQRNKEEVVKKKVYVCPEAACVHHDPARALGDLTGIKKHFFRKHGEKKWKCEKCSKRYAVQSDWKAHSKICGTREYRCDCGTLFSRRDSFITHRAFCDALAEENSKSNPFSSSQTAPNHPQIHNFHNPTLIPLKHESQSFSVPPWLSPDPTPGAGAPSPSINPFFAPHQSIQQNPNPNNIPTDFSSSSFISATALLQKAAKMGYQPSPDEPSLMRPHHHVTTTTAGMPSREEMGKEFFHGLASYGNKLANLTAGCMELQDINMVGSSLPSTSGFDAFDQDSFNGILNPKRSFTSFQDDAHLMDLRKEGGGGSGGAASGRGDGMTRDFLGLRPFPDRDFGNMAYFDQMGSSSYDHQAQNQAPWQS